MISFSAINIESKRKNLYFNNLSFKKSGLESIIAEGDKYLNEGKFQEAIKTYNKAAKEVPDDVQVNRKLAKAYYNLKDYKQAESNINKYIKENPEDFDAYIDLGNIQTQQGFYKKALANYEKALSIDNENDLAKRNILQTKNKILSIYSPDRAYKERYEYAEKNLNEAITLAAEYLGTDFMSQIQDVKIKFGITEKMGGVSNIAQYENNINSMVVSDDYTYASPVVIAAYLTHEAIHAKDKDAYTSVREEQDAYIKAAKFWLKYAGSTRDSEMDYVADLYKKSPASLKNRVKEIYQMRDPSIAMTSPNHPPSNKNSKLNKSANASNQPLKEYSYIA